LSRPAWSAVANPVQLQTFSKKFLTDSLAVCAGLAGEKFQKIGQIAALGAAARLADAMSLCVRRWTVCDTQTHSHLVKLLYLLDFIGQLRALQLLSA